MVARSVAKVSCPNGGADAITVAATSMTRKPSFCMRSWTSASSFIRECDSLSRLGVAARWSHTHSHRVTREAGLCGERCEQCLASTFTFKSGAAYARSSNEVRFRFDDNTRPQPPENPRELTCSPGRLRRIPHQTPQSLEEATTSNFNQSQHTFKRLHSIRDSGVRPY